LDSDDLPADVEALAGIDNVRFAIPADASEGRRVPVQVRAGSVEADPAGSPTPLSNPQSLQNH
jgi:hypothetical protein